MGSELRRCRSDPGPFTYHRRQSNKTENDALDYLKAVKREFAENPDSYDNFLQIMKDFKNMTISTEEVVRRVKALFRRHPDLILGFNQFLPIDYKITLPKESTVGFSEAMNYVTKIKDRFTDEKHIYTTFLNILRSYKKMETKTQDVIDEVEHLFRDHPDLMEEFLLFVPGGAT